MKTRAKTTNQKSIVVIRCKKKFVALRERSFDSVLFGTLLVPIFKLFPIILSFIHSFIYSFIHEQIQFDRMVSSIARNAIVTACTIVKDQALNKTTRIKLPQNQNIINYIDSVLFLC